MIKFFRKIRYNLMEQNKTGKYLKYAIGEIVLVVVGILIALSINNWNQKRIAFYEEQVLLKILKNDFENRLSELEQLNEGRKDGIKALEELMSLTNNLPVNYNAKRIDSLLVIATVTYRFNNQFSTLDMLFNSGRINTLSNDSLKALLTNWPNLVEEMIEEQNLIVDNYKEIVKVLDKHISLRDIFQNFSWRYHKTPQMEPSKLLKDYNGLVNDRSFENLLASKHFLLNINIVDSDLIIEDSKKIIEILDKEITE